MLASGFLAEDLDCTIYLSYLYFIDVILVLMEY
jgi:hypothetical protein